MTICKNVKMPPPLVIKTAGSLIYKRVKVRKALLISKKRFFSTGGSDDWAKGVAGIKYSYTIELPDTGSHGFVLPAHEIEPVGQETWAAVKSITKHLTDAHVQ